MGQDAWRECDPPQKTTFEDLHLTIACSTRLSIVIALSLGPRDVNQLGTHLGFGQSLLSNHLKVLRRMGFVDFNRDGGRHVYHLTSGLRVGIESSGITVCLKASDRSTLVATISSESPVIRQLQAALRGSVLLDNGNALS